MLNDEKILIKAYCNKGILLSRLERHNEAIECFHLALLIDPYDYESLLSEAVSLDKLGLHEAAIKNFDLVIASLTISEDTIIELDLLMNQDLDK